MKQTRDTVRNSSRVRIQISSIVIRKSKVRYRSARKMYLLPNSDTKEKKVCHQVSHNTFHDKAVLRYARNPTIQIQGSSYPKLVFIKTKKLSTKLQEVRLRENVTSLLMIFSLVLVSATLASHY
ncbi:hypothetical protein METBIDRAFT_103972 [Metschnikowia bicuspidata var. bicuspidata NRRL YB-4993]|uniref:Uncharacterized protein n=1 Tax=Metschnikowia bicuspidata var. bicuspidata NRRL YB-4993 TaxID=869754 RepID=A0A1A0HHF4_9ASCO|nr:hypothetical protein METBIDRAFT_103972 [Metschnikowia bicuspidata var. bicuspidata NRRL YB-4993]OBA23307.1 hypothetical protein METBIDRAFT_103972 [Metschnikowia bicuspidata var. bicuspidata NRRL YB-4993]